MGQVYVDSEAMTTWKNNMQSVNSDCIDNIDKMDSVIASFSDSLQGDFADKYTESFTSMTQIIKESHNNMKDFSGFLDKIFEIMNKQ